jgi:hypothetical protein
MATRQPSAVSIRLENQGNTSCTIFYDDRDGILLVGTLNSCFRRKSVVTCSNTRNSNATASAQLFHTTAVH